MKKLTQEQRMAFVMAMQMKSTECSKLAVKLAEGKDALPAHAKTGEADGCNLMVAIYREAINIDESSLGYLEMIAYNCDCAASEARTEDSRIFFEHKAAAIRSAKLCLADLLGVTKETPKAPTFEEMKKKALSNLAESYKETATCIAKKAGKDSTYHTFIDTYLEKAYTSIGLITPEEAYVVRFKVFQDVQEQKV